MIGGLLGEDHLYTAKDGSGRTLKRIVKLPRNTARCFVVDHSERTRSEQPLNTILVKEYRSDDATDDELTSALHVIQCELCVPSDV